MLRFPFGIYYISQPSTCLKGMSLFWSRRPFLLSSEKEIADEAQKETNTDAHEVRHVFVNAGRKNWLCVHGFSYLLEYININYNMTVLI